MSVVSSSTAHQVTAVRTWIYQRNLDKFIDICSGQEIECIFGFIQNKIPTFTRPIARSTLRAEAALCEIRLAIIWRGFEKYKLAPFGNPLLAHSRSTADFCPLQNEMRPSRFTRLLQGSSIAPWIRIIHWCSLRLGVVAQNRYNLHWRRMRQEIRDLWIITNTNY